MSTQNVYSPDYDNQGNPKDSIPELKDAIENSVVDAENFASATSSFTDDNGNTYQKGAKGWAADAEGYKNDAQTAKNTAEAAKDATYERYKSYETETQNHIDRVSNDGGIILAPDYLNAIIKEAKRLGVFSDLAFFSHDTGIRFNASSGRVEKAYAVGGINDVDLTTPSDSRSPGFEDWPEGNGRLAQKFRAGENVTLGGSGSSVSVNSTGLVLGVLFSYGSDLTGQLLGAASNNIKTSTHRLRAAFYESDGQTKTSPSTEDTRKADPYPIHDRLNDVVATASRTTNDIKLDFNRGDKVFTNAGALDNDLSQDAFGFGINLGTDAKLGPTYVVNADPDTFDLSALRTVIAKRYRDTFQDKNTGAATVKETLNAPEIVYGGFQGYDIDVQRHIRRVHEDGGIVPNPEVLNEDIVFLKRHSNFADSEGIFAADYGVKLEGGYVTKIYDVSRLEVDFTHTTASSGQSSTIELVEESGRYYLDFKDDDSYFKRVEVEYDNKDVHFFTIFERDDIRGGSREDILDGQLEVIGGAGKGSTINKGFFGAKKQSLTDTFQLPSFVSAFWPQGEDARSFLNSRGGPRFTPSSTPPDKNILRIGHRGAGTDSPFIGKFWGVVISQGVADRSSRLAIEHRFSKDFDIPFSAKKSRGRLELSGFCGKYSAQYDPNIDSTIIACLMSGGNIKVLEFDNASREVVDRNIIRTNYSRDSHTEGKLLVRSDGKYVVGYSGHVDVPMHCKISDNAGDISSFGNEITIEPDPNTYLQLVQLPDENDDIYAFYRLNRLNKDRVFRKSTDGGSTWSSPTKYFTSADRPYTYVRASKTGRIDFTARRDTGNSNLYHFYYEGGNWYKSDGTLIGGSSALPLTFSDVTPIFSSTPNGRARFSTLMYNLNGKPIGVTDLFLGARREIHFYKFDSNTGWETKLVDVAENNKAGKPTLIDENTVYYPKFKDGTFNIYKARRDSNGKWVSEIIEVGEERLNRGEHSNVRTQRVSSPRDHSSGLKVFWLDRYVSPGFLNSWDYWMSDIRFDE